MLIKTVLQKSPGFCLALVIALGFSLVSFGIPERAAAQARPTVQAGAHPIDPGPQKLGTREPDPMNAARPILNPGQPDRFANPPPWDGRRMFLNLQACGGYPSSLFYNPLPGFSIGTQASGFPLGMSGVQGILNGPDLMSLYNYSSGQGVWWPDSYASLNPLLASCGGFQGFWSP